MNSPYDQLDAEIKRLIRQGCSPVEVSQQLVSQYPKLNSEASQVLKRIQSIERDLRKLGH